MPLANRRASTKVELKADIVRQGSRAAADQDGREEQLALVDESGPERVRRKLGTADRKVAPRCRLQLPDRVGVEIALEPAR